MNLLLECCSLSTSTPDQLSSFPALCSYPIHPRALVPVPTLSGVCSDADGVIGHSISVFPVPSGFTKPPRDLHQISTRFCYNGDSTVDLDPNAGFRNTV